jgi:hypothetical protein
MRADGGNHRVEIITPPRLCLKADIHCISTYKVRIMGQGTEGAPTKRAIEIFEMGRNRGSMVVRSLRRGEFKARLSMGPDS